MEQPRGDCLLGGDRAVAGQVAGLRAVVANLFSRLVLALRSNVAKLIAVVAPRATALAVALLLATGGGTLATISSLLGLGSSLKSQPLLLGQGRAVTADVPGFLASPAHRPQVVGAVAGQMTLLIAVVAGTLAGLFLGAVTRDMTGLSAVVAGAATGVATEVSATVATLRAVTGDVAGLSASVASASASAASAAIASRLRSIFSIWASIQSGQR